MKQVNLIISLLLIFAGIWAFDIKAATKHNSFVIEKVLEKGINTPYDEFSKAPLIEYSINGYFGIVKSILEHHANVDIQDNNGHTALMYSSENGHTRIVELLLSYNANVNIIDESGRTALMYASEGGHAEIVGLLLKNNADISIKNEEILRYIKKNPELQKFYEEYLENINKSIIINLTETNNFKEIKKILTQFPNLINKPNKHGELLLFVAISMGNFDLIKKLFEDPEIIVKPNLIVDNVLSPAKNPIAYAEQLSNPSSDKNRKKYRDIAEYLTKQYHSAKEKLLAEKKAEQLLKMYAEIKTHEDGETALIYVSRRGKTDIVNFLLNAGVNVNIRDKEGCTALMWASRDNYIEIVKLLLKNNADVNLKDNDGWTALMYASLNDHNEIVKLLLEHNADISIKNENEETALKYIKENPKLQKVYEEYLDKQINELINLGQNNDFKKIREILIKSPHLINQTNKYGETLLSNAILFGRFDLIIQLFEDPDIKIKPDLITDILSKTDPITYAENLGSPNLDYLNYGLDKPKKVYLDPKKIYREIAKYLKHKKDIQEK